MLGTSVVRYFAQGMCLCERLRQRKFDYITAGNGKAPGLENPGQLQTSKMAAQPDVSHRVIPSTCLKVHPERQA
jgi:hypothetical protein